MLWWKLITRTVVRTTMCDLVAVSENLKFVRERISAVSLQRPKELEELCPTPRLVAVSKTKPKEAIIQAYQDGQRHFGENYVQELFEKASSPEVQENCPEIQWHFIGHLQRGNVSKLVKVADRLFLIETVDSLKLANALQEALKKKGTEKPVNIYVQVNTSGEEAKSGVSPSELVGLAKHIIEKCPNLHFQGLMTIGAIDNTDDIDNEDFKLLFNLREEVCKELDLDPKNVELSMGMSGDFDKAILLGSTNVRIGSTIFGARQYKAQADAAKQA